jgi:tetratricopeptide (TPR) repeat protein
VSQQDPIVAELERATVLCELGRFSDARALLSRVVATAPDNGHAWCLMAQARLGEGDSASALEAAKRAVYYEPKLEWPYRLASAALSLAGQHRHAAKAAREAVALDPHRWQTHARLAHAMSHDQATAAELQEAQGAAGRAVTLAPHEAAAHMAVGAVAAAAGHRLDAAGAFRRALEIDPQNSAAHHELARMRLRKSRLGIPEARRLADAATDFATAVGADPRAATSRRSLEGVLRVFLARTAYFVFLDAFFVARLGANSTHAFTRVLPIVLLVLPGAYAVRFVSRLSPSLRAHLFQLLLAPGIRLAATLEALAIATILVGPLVSQSSRRDVAAVAGLAAIAGRVILYRERRRAPASA